MENADWKDAWPPPNGKKFIESEDFGALVVDEAKRLIKKFPRYDFTDAVAHVYTWFSKKVSRNRRFINSKRFPTAEAFVAYIRAALWNASRISARSRQRQREISALPVEEPITDDRFSLENLDQLLERVEALNDPHKTVFTAIWLDEASEHELAMLAGALDRTLQEVYRIYEEAIDMLDP
jgi:hypothetical protein